MAGLQANAVFTYGKSTANIDGTVTVRLTCAQPGEGSGLPGDFQVTLTAADVSTIQAAVGNPAKKTALDTIVTTYLKAAYRPSTAIQASLDLLVGLTLTVA